MLFPEGYGVEKPSWSPPFERLVARCVSNSVWESIGGRLAQQALLSCAAKRFKVDGA